MGVLNCCVVGYGGIALYHVEALKKIKGVVLHTVVGRRPEPTISFKEEHGFLNASSCYEEALSASEIDAIIITSPSELHYEMTAAALRAGKDVLVEIPLAMSARGARELEELARRQERRLMVAHSRRFEAGGLFVRDFIGSGQLGQVHQHHAYSFSLRHKNVGWTGYQRSWVDDVLFHHGCHLVDFSLWTLDAEVERVRGELSPLHPAIGTSLDVSMLLRYAKGTIATISLSYNALQGASGQLYLGEKGTLELRGNKVIFAGEVVFESQGDQLTDAVLSQDREFVAAIRENRQPSCSAADGLQALEPLQEVYDQMIQLEGEEKYRRPWGI